MSASSPQQAEEKEQPTSPTVRSSKRGPGTPRAIRAKADKFAKNIENRGQVPTTKKAKEEGPGVGPVVLAFILFVVLGSAVLQVLRGW